MDQEVARRRLEFGQELLSSVRDALAAASPKGYQELKPLDYPVIMMYSRCRSLFEGATILLHENLAEEAIALCRSLFEESLRLMHLAKEGDLRWRYVAGWLLESIDYKRSLVRDASSEEARLKANERLAHLEEEEREVRKAMQRFEIVTEKRFSSTENLATLHGRTEDLWPYKLGHRMVHGSQVALAYRSSKTILGDSEQAYMLCVRSNEPIPKLIAIVFGIRSVLFAHEAVAKIFDFIPHIDRASEFFSEIEAIQSE